MANGLADKPTSLALPTLPTMASGETKQLLLEVAVPPGAAPGQILQFQTPAGAVQAAVPPGLKPGQTFQVQIPQPALVLAVPTGVVVANPTGSTPLTGISGPPVQPGAGDKGVPPGAPAGGQWMTVKYWGAKTWGLMFLIILVNLGLVVLFANIGDGHALAVICCGFYLFVYIGLPCGACVDMRKDERDVYTLGGPGQEET